MLHNDAILCLHAAHTIRTSKFAILWKLCQFLDCVIQAHAILSYRSRDHVIKIAESHHSTSCQAPVSPTYMSYFILKLPIFQVNSPTPKHSNTWKNHSLDTKAEAPFQRDDLRSYHRWFWLKSHEIRAVHGFVTRQWTNTTPATTVIAVRWKTIFESLGGNSNWICSHHALVSNPI